ncbi:MAG: hypothetical protein JWM98_2181 [Thermoleophilia bacterium]|nr:hypothetical protein [Thermoleophilia bacterium]
MQVPRLTVPLELQRLRSSVDALIADGSALSDDLMPVVVGDSGSAAGLVRRAGALERGVAQVVRTFEVRSPGSALGTDIARTHVDTAARAATLVKSSHHGAALPEADRFRMLDLQDGVDETVTSLRLRRMDLQSEVRAVHRNQVVAGVVGVGAAAGLVGLGAAALDGSSGVGSGGDESRRSYPTHPSYPGSGSGYGSPGDEDF